MQVLKIRKFIIGLLLIGVVFVAPNVVVINAISNDALIENITWDDWGIEGHYTFANVTYNTDGTGTDVLDSDGSSAGVGASLDFYLFEGQESFSGKLHTKIGIGVYGPNAGSGAEISSGESLWTYEDLEAKFNPAGSGAGISVTNQTTNEKLFDYNEKEKYATGGHDFSSDFDTDTVWFDKNCSTAANAFNISSEYQEWNETLTDTADLDIDDYFNNAGENKESTSSLDYYNQHTQGETYVVGYEDARAGVIDDLRSYLALINGKDFSDIVITNYNLSTAKVSYNMSEDLAGQIRDVVDYHIDQEASSSAVWLTIFGTPILSLGSTSTAKFGGSGAALANGPRLGTSRIGTSMKSGFVSFGTKLQQFGTSATNWLGARIQDTQRAADKAYQTIGGTIKSALSGGYKSLQSAANYVVNLGKSFGTGVKNLATKTVHFVQSIASKMLKVLTNPIFLLCAAAVIIVVAYVILKKTDKI